MTGAMGQGGDMVKAGLPQKDELRMGKGVS